MSTGDTTPLVEEWRDVIGFPGYQVSNLGNGRSRWKFGAGGLGDTWHPVKLKATKDGHLQMRLNRKSRYIHRLILEAFIGPCPKGMECLHADDNPANNALTNISWGTRLKNMEDRSRNGRVPRGDNCSWSKVSEHDVPVIRKRAGDGESLAVIAKDYNVTESAIRLIVKRINFRHVT